MEMELRVAKLEKQMTRGRGGARSGRELRHARPWFEQFALATEL